MHNQATGEHVLATYYTLGLEQAEAGRAACPPRSEFFGHDCDRAYMDGYHAPVRLEWLIPADIIGQEASEQ